jgi:hypothetical protein
MTAKVALDNNADYLMFIDDDVIIPMDTINRLLRCNADVAAGWTIIRGYPYKNMFFKYMDFDRVNLINYPDDEIPAEDTILEVGAVGFSCVLIKVDALRKVPSPWFVTGPFNTEDIYYCVKALRHCMTCGGTRIEQRLVETDPETICKCEVFKEHRIVVDTSVKTAHNLGEEYIEPATKLAYRKYYEGLYPEVLTEKQEEGKGVLPEIEPNAVMDYEEVLKEALSLS